MNTLCVKCNQAATFFCNACGEAPQYTIPSENTHYCSSDCQQADLSRHKHACELLKVRKAFYQAAAVLQDMFFVYLEKMFNKEIHKIERIDGKLFVDYSKWRGKGFLGLHPFPAHLCENKEEEKSILAHLACCDSVAWMHEVVGYLLKDLAKDIREITVIAKNPRRGMGLVTKRGSTEVETNSEFLHELFKVVLITEEVYALDLSGPQSGFHNPVTPWSDYVDDRIDMTDHFDKVSFYALGHFQETLKSQLANGEFKIRDVGRIHLHLYACQTLKEAVTKWECRNDLSVGALLQLGPQSFEEKKKNLVENLQVQLLQNLDTWETACKKELAKQA